jgi:hypothetical protein
MEEANYVVMLCEQPESFLLHQVHRILPSLPVKDRMGVLGGEDLQEWRGGYR